MSSDTKSSKFGVVSAVGSNHLIGGAHSSRKFIQSFFQGQTIEWKEKDKVLAIVLDRESYLKLEIFFRNYPSNEYYLFTADEEIHFTFRKLDMDAETSKVAFHVNKLEKLVYPEIELVR